MKAEATAGFPVDLKLEHCRLYRLEVGVYKSKSNL
jgi:hypothetical protein